MTPPATPRSSRRRSIAAWCGLSLGGALVVPRAEAQDSAARRHPAAIEGCWEADRALMAQLVDLSEDRATRLLILSPGGGVGRPLLPLREAQLMWEPRSAWSVTGDSVHLRVSTGQVGWDARLALSPGGDRLQGRARYLTDAIVRGRSPESVSLSLARVLCNPTWRRPDTSANYSARRNGQPYFASQVTRQAARDPQVALPAGMQRVRLLDEAEEATWNAFVHRVRESAEPTLIVSAVIEADGRVHPSTVVVREKSGSVPTGAPAQVPALLREVRFVPAQRENAPVAVLAYLVVVLAAP
jgi:hypothetical protein